MLPAVNSLESACESRESRGTDVRRNSQARVGWKGWNGGSRFSTAQSGGAANCITRSSRARFVAGASAQLQATCVRRASNEGREQTPRRSFFRRAHARAHRSSIESCCATYLVQLDPNLPSMSYLAARRSSGRPDDGQFRQHAARPWAAWSVDSCGLGGGKCVSAVLCHSWQHENGTSRLQPWMSSSP